MKVTVITAFRTFSSIIPATFHVMPSEYIARRQSLLLLKVQVVTLSSLEESDWFTADCIASPVSSLGCCGVYTDGPFITLTFYFFAHLSPPPLPPV